MDTIHYTRTWVIESISLLISAKVIFSFFYLIVILITFPIQVILITISNGKNCSFETFISKIPEVKSN